MNTITVTGDLGPELTAAALELSDITNLNVDFLAKVVKVSHGLTNNKTTVFAYTGIGTVTWTISGQSTTIVMS